jgi:hypothetical protein
MMTQNREGGGKGVATPVETEIDSPIAFIRYWQLSYKEGAEVFNVDHVTVRRWFNQSRSPDKGYCLAANLMHQLWQRQGKSPAS